MRGTTTEQHNCSLEIETLGARGWQALLRRSTGEAIRLELQSLSDDVAVPNVLDGIVAAALPFAIQEGGTLHVNGPLTRGALRNFTECAEAWHSWNPSRFHRLCIQASSIVDGMIFSGPHQAVTAWSGSLRSTHTLIRHATRAIAGAFALHSALRVIGLHPEDDADGLEPARQTLATLGLPLAVVRVRTSAPQPVEPEIGALPWVAAALHAVAGGQRIGLHARTRRATTTTRYPRPGPDLFDCYAGDAQPIRADGGAATPTQMARDLHLHPAFTALISNCHRNPRHRPACGRCPDCTLANLALYACTSPPPAHAKRPGRFAVATLPMRNPVWADDAFSIMGDWSARDAALKSPLAYRCNFAGKAALAGETARWLAAVVGLHPPWPR